MLSADMANAIFSLVVMGKSFEDSGLSKEHEEHFLRIQEQVATAPEGTMMSPVNEWVGTEYDDLIEIFENQYAEVEKQIARKVGNYEVSKSEGAKRYTLGAMYIPDRVDAHNEWTDAEELQRAVWEYVRSNDRRIRLQHNRDVVAGEWVEVMTFPYELTVPIQTPSGIPINHTYPPNTVFLGVIWEPWAWEDVKNGKK